MKSRSHNSRDFSPDWETARTLFAALRQRGQVITVGDSLEAKGIALLLREKDVWALKDSDLSGYWQRADLSAVPAFLNEYGFHHYLPRLLLYCASHPNNGDLLIYSLISGLNRFDPKLAGQDYSDKQYEFLFQIANKIASKFEAGDDSGEQLIQALNRYKVR